MISYYGSKLASVATDCFTAICTKKTICQNMVKKMQNNRANVCKIRHKNTIFVKSKDFLYKTDESWT